MTDEQKSKRWPDRTITKRSNERRAERHQMFLAAGWNGESAFLTAVGNGIIEVPSNPEGAAQTAQKASE